MILLFIVEKKLNWVDLCILTLNETKQTLKDLESFAEVAMGLMSQ